MRLQTPSRATDAIAIWSLAGLTLTATITIISVAWINTSSAKSTPAAPKKLFEPRQFLDSSGYSLVNDLVEPWQAGATLKQYRDAFFRVGYRAVEQLDQSLNSTPMPAGKKVSTLYAKVLALNYEGEAKQAYECLQQMRDTISTDDLLSREALYSVVFMQGVTALRRGENENCIMCRGESSCILPISRAAIHANPEGSRLAIHHFSEYLKQFPDDADARWLLNVAHMTLGEYPDKVPPEYLVSIDHYVNSEFDIGKFRDIGHKVGVNRLNQAGGAIMDDFDNDGLLDIVTSTFDPTSSMSLYRNDGRGKFELSASTGLVEQLGGLNCMQTDYNNDGYLDIFVVRGAWLNLPMRPSLLRNNKDGTFTDVTEAAGLMYPANSIAAAWADYDNDGRLDLFVCCERQASRLYRNLGNDRFEEVTNSAGIATYLRDCKGAAWIDYDNDGYQDLFVNYLSLDSAGQLYHNNRDGTFTETGSALGIDGPQSGFSCWAFDYDNDGWLDIFATCYMRTMCDVVNGLQGVPHTKPTGRLYRNLKGKGFANVVKDAGLDGCYSAMGSNFADFDNDGFLDLYLGTGEPSLSMLIPNRMFKNVNGNRFAEITGTSGTGNLQKGHGVACGDWDRDGNIDIFIEMGGAVNGDKYHNILFQNPGHPSHSLTVKLLGEKTNRAAIGARIKIVTAGAQPQTIHRHISTGSSFGANPLQQTIGVGQADRIALLEINWPTSGTTQVFKDLAVDQAIEITEFATDYRKLDWKPVPLTD